MNKFELVQSIISKIMKIPVEKVTLESVKSDFENWDSLNQLNLVMELEANFNVSIPIDEIANIDSVQSILHILNNIHN
ncbi:phosphopantetheine-binding protein [Paenibacillus peoriae]|uniref:acyl carrier protein n=1 Tax=Paenibacillus peoriae TaxID=59893 RepID=UPI00026C5E6B|nr:phosphopantetheine-binding protein [Paenibacillus peoriae]MEC0183483.1 phosphopantetheine-binding protein [Paenibacillus peoriae]